MPSLPRCLPFLLAASLIGCQPSAQTTPADHAANGGSLYNDVARNAKRLDDNLSLKPQEIVYVNQQTRSNVTYTLKYDPAKKAWYLAEASSTAPAENPQSGAMDVFRGTASYPADFAWTPISQIDPEKLQDAMDKHRAVVQ
ncbi:hypothetical protein NB693_25670 [Pantoea ananatis]|uniref:hypothetical protein n=1 Tax=Pantoea ananas TaxID=553 RepID=UPI002220A74C|nr:hypothetical protein [Pantoea ananatis]